MRKLLHVLLSLALVFWQPGYPVVPDTAHAAIPLLINYQGVLTDSTGVALQGSVTLTFRLYDAATSGSQLWTEDHSFTLAEADSGVFNVILGSVTALTSVDFNQPMWISVQVSGDSEMSPRQRMTAVGYAINADKMDGLDSTSFLRTDVDTSTSGKLTITRSGVALLIKPTTDPAASTKLIDVQNAAGTSKFSVDLEGDTTVAGDLAVTGTISGSTSTSGTTSASWVVGTATDATAADVSLLLGQSSGRESLVFDGDSTDDFLLSDDLQLLTQSALRLTDSDSSNYVALQAPATVSTNVSWTLPSADGSANQVLTTDGASTLSWTTASGISGVGDITAVTAGSGLSGGGTSGDVTLTVATDGITAAMIIADAVGASEIATDGVGSAEIAADAVGTSEIATDGVGAAEIAADAVGSSELASTAVTAASYGSATQSPSFTVDADGRLTAASNNTISLTSANIQADQLNFSEFTDSMSLDATTTIDMNATAGTDLILDDMSSAEQLILQNAQSTADRADLYVADATANRITIGDFVIAVSDSAAGVVIDTQGSADLSETGGSPALTNTSDAREALAIASDVTATASDGVLKMGIKDSKWEYIWYNASEDKFVLSASTRVESSSPAYLLFSPPAAVGQPAGTRYGIKFDPEVTPKTLSFVEITSPLSNPVENTLFEMKAGGRLGMEFANLVKNGSFEAFSAMEAFHAYDASYTTAATTATQFGGVWNQTNGFQGGWDNFAPDEWTWVAGDVFQHSPHLLGTTGATTNFNSDAAHGRSAVAVKDSNTAAAYITLGDNPFPEGAIKHKVTNLKPSTTYAVGVKALVSNATNTTALLDVDGEDAGGQLTKIGSATTGALTTTATTYTDLVGTFKTTSTAGEITVYLICRQTGTPALTDVCRFDAVQLVASKSVPEFAPNTIVDTGDQTLYGSLRLGRTTDDKGGILSVDQFVRTRGIELFTDDPGLSGKVGGAVATLGGGGIMPPGPGWNETSGGQAGTSLYVEGSYASTATPYRSYKVKIDTDGAPDKFSWWYSDDTTQWKETSGATGVTMATTQAGATLLNAGVKVWFSSGTAGAVGDAWWFSASNQQQFGTGTAATGAAGGYDSYAKTATYTAGESRIYKDPDKFSPTYNKLVLQDGATKVALQDLAGLVTKPSTINPPTAGGPSYGLMMSAWGNYTGSGNRTYHVEIAALGTAGMSSDQFRWKKSTDNGVTWSPFSINTTIPSTEYTLEDGVKISFSENNYTNDSTTTGGAIGNYWTFSVTSGTSGTTAAAKVDSIKSSVGGTDRPAITGAARFIQGSNVTLDQSGNDITITASLQGADALTVKSAGGTLDDTAHFLGTELIGGLGTLVETVDLDPMAPIDLRTRVKMDTTVVPQLGVGNLFNPGSADVTPITIRKTSSAAPVANLFAVTDNAATTTYLKVTAGGALQGNAVSGWDTDTTNDLTTTTAWGGDLAGSGASPTLATGAVTSTKIFDGTITNDDVATTAAIAKSKIGTTGTWATGDLPADGYGSTYVNVTGDTMTGDLILDTTGADELATAGNGGGLSLSNTAGSEALVVVTNPSATDADGVIKLGRDAGAYEYIWYDADARDGKGEFVFSASTRTIGSSPAYLTFGESSSSNLYALKFDGTTKILEFVEINPATNPDTETPLFQFGADGSFSVRDPAGTIRTLVDSKGTFKAKSKNIVQNASFDVGWDPVKWENFNSGYVSPLTSTAKFGTKALAVSDHDTTLVKGMKQILPYFDHFKGEVMTLTVWARHSGAAGTVNASIGFDDGVTAAANRYKDITLTTTYQQFSYTFPFPAAATKLDVYLYGAAGGDSVGAATNKTHPTDTTIKVYYDGVTLAPGPLAIDYEPSPIFDTGQQVIYGNLAIGAHVNPNSGGQAQLIFGEPPAGFAGAGDGFGVWGGGAGTVTYEQWGGNSGGRFFINKGVKIAPAGSTFGSSLHLPMDPNASVSSEALFQMGASGLGQGSAGGTYVGVQAQNTFTGDFINFEKSGVTKFRVDKDGNITGTLASGGDVTDVLAGTGISVTNSIGPQPSVAINTAVVPQLGATNTFTATTASPIKIKPSSAPTANTKLLDMQATGVGTTNFSVDAEGDVVANSLDLTVALAEADLPTISKSKISTTGTWATGDLPADGYAATYVNEGQAGSITSAMITNAEIVDADISASAAIAKSKLAALNIADADVATTAAIAKSKISTAGTWAAADLPSDGYASTYVNVTGDTMTGDLALPTSGVISAYGGIGPYENLLKHSEDFTNAAWARSTGVGVVTPTNNTAPNGTATADTVPAGDDANDTIAQVTGTGAASTQFTGSVWLKVSSGTPTVTLSLDSDGGTAAATSGSDTSASVTTTWQRFSVTKTFGTGTGSLRFLIKHGTTAVIAWGAQVESTVAAPGVYVRTTTDTQTASRGVISDGSPASTASVKSFETVAVGGQSNVVADSSTDTLTFAGSGNVSITTDASTDTITISHSGAASGLETGTTSHSFTWDTDSSGTVDQDMFLYFEDDANATAHSLAWDDGLDSFLFDDDLLLQRSGDVSLKIDANTDSPTAEAKLLTIQKGGASDTVLFTVDAEGDVIANSLDLTVALAEADLPTISKSKISTTGTWATGDLPADGYAATYVNEGQAGSITSAMITNAEIVDADISATAAIVDTKLATISTAGKVADSALSSTVTKLGATIESAEITDGQVATADLADGAVTSAKLADGAITAADMAVGSVGKSQWTELRPHAQATPDATVRVEAGIVAVHQNEKIDFAAANSPAFAAVTANSRIDVLTLSKTGVLKITQGTQAASPAAPTYPLNELPIAEVTITETATPVIADADIKDVRFFLDIEGTHEQVEATFTVGILSDATTTDLSVLFGQATGQESLKFQGASSDDFILSDDLRLAAQSSLRLEDAAGGEYVALKAPATVAANVTWMLPAADGSASQVLKTDGAGNLGWASGLTNALTNTNIFVGNASNVATAVAMSGDVTIDNTGATAIGAGKVTSAKILDGEIVNADISATAAIADTKLATIATAGKVADSALSSNVSLLGSAIESGEITDGQVATADLADNAVTDAKVADDLTISTSKDLSVNADKKINMEGSAGDTYAKFNSSNNSLEIYVNGTMVARAKP